MSTQGPANLYTLGFGTRPENVEVPVVSTRPPAATDHRYPIGKKWIDTLNNGSYTLTSVSTTAGVISANWEANTPGTSEVDTLTGDTGGAIGPTGGNINIVGGDGLTVDGSGSTLTINRDANGGYPVTPYVVGAAGEAGYPTIQEAVNAANSAGGGVVWVQPGTYTEDLTLYDNIFIMGGDDANSIITGVHTPPNSGTLSFENISLTSATDIISSAAAGSTAITFINCYMEITNGFIFDVDNWTGDLGIYQCTSVGTNNGVVNNSGGATLSFYASVVGAGTTATMVTSGTCLWDDVDINCPVDHQTGSALQIFSCQFAHSQTLSNDTSGYMANCSYSTGSDAAITMSSSGNVTLKTSSVTSTASPCIAGAGAGTLFITGCDFIGDSTFAATLTIDGGITRSNAFSTTNLTNNLVLEDNTITAGGSGALGLLIGNQATCATIDVGDIAPTASRTITVGGGTVVTAAVTDTIDIGPDGATTNADSVKTVNVNTGTVAVGQLLTNIASGSVTSGTHTTSIASGNVTAGTVAVNLLTGTGTKTLNVGNSTGTTINMDGPLLVNDSVNSNTSINTGTSTGTVSIGNAAAGALTLDTAAGISLDAATASNFTVTGAADLTLSSTAGAVIASSAEAAADAIQLTASDGAGGITASVGTGHFNLGGNLNFTTAGNKILSASVATTTTAGANSFGSVTLTAGTATVSTTAVTTNSLIYIWRQSIGATGAAALGALSVGTITNGVSFVVSALDPADATSAQATDVSVVGWMIVN